MTGIKFQKLSRGKTHDNSRKSFKGSLYTVFVVLCALAVLLLNVKGVDAASQGPIISGTGADNAGVGTIAWTGFGNITANDGSNATDAITSAATGHYLFATNFGFTIPTGSTITGIQADVEELATTASKNTINDNSIKIIQAGAVAGTDQSAGAAWPTTATLKTYGSSSNLWGLSWTSAQINASNFGVAISAKNVKSGNGSSTLTASVDYVQITVTYTPPPNTPPGQAKTGPPSNGSTVSSINPALQMRATDPDADDVKFKVFIFNTTANSGGVCTGTLIETGTQTVTGTGWDNGTTAYASGAPATYTVQTALTGGNSYCWQAQAVDPLGTGNYGTLSVPFIFTVAPTTDQFLRGGTYFNGGTEQPLYWSQ